MVSDRAGHSEGPRLQHLLQSPGQFLEVIVVSCILDNDALTFSKVPVCSFSSLVLLKLSKWL